MIDVVSVKFKNKGKVYFFDPSGCEVKTGDSVIVETAKGLEFAECTYGNHQVEDTAVVQPLRPVIRIATEADIKRAEENKKREKEAFEICQQKIAQHGLDMKLIDVEFNFEGSKILFFFTSDGRVDFRDLVKDLASVFKTRIELRQIGVRDEARMLGGLGICGRPFCCTQFLDEFHPVSIKMAKTQGLSLNPTKISGTCGRLMCCLKHEQAAYEDIVKKAPKNDAFVKTPFGYGSVVSVNLLRGQAKIRLEDGTDTSLKTFTFEELEVLGGKGRLSEYQAAKAEGRLEQAGFAPIEPRQPEIPKVLSGLEAISAINVQASQPARNQPSKKDEKLKTEKQLNNKNRNQNQRKKPRPEKPIEEKATETETEKQPEQKAKQNRRPNNRRYNNSKPPKKEVALAQQNEQPKHENKSEKPQDGEHKPNHRRNYHRRRPNNKPSEATKTE